MFNGQREEGYNEVAKIASFVDFKKEVKGEGVKLGIEEKGYVILG